MYNLFFQVLLYNPAKNHFWNGSFKVEIHEFMCGQILWNIRVNLCSKHLSAKSKKQNLPRIGQLSVLCSDSKVRTNVVITGLWDNIGTGTLVVILQTIKCCIMWVTPHAGLPVIVKHYLDLRTIRYMDGWITWMRCECRDHGGKEYVPLGTQRHSGWCTQWKDTWRIKFEKCFCHKANISWLGTLPPELAIKWLTFPTHHSSLMSGIDHTCELRAEVDRIMVWGVILCQCNITKCSRSQSPKHCDLIVM